MEYAYFHLLDQLYDMLYVQVAVRKAALEMKRSEGLFLLHNPWILFIVYLLLFLLLSLVRIEITAL